MTIRRKAFRFRLFTLLVVGPIVAMCLQAPVLFFRDIVEGSRQSKIVSMADRLGAEAVYANHKFGAFRRELLGGEYFSDILCLDLSGSLATDLEMERISQLNTLRDLDLAATRITDSGMQQISVLTQLHRLNVGRTGITDFSLGYLTEMKDLRKLDLSATSITDAGLKAIGRLPDLEYLDLSGTLVSDNGLSHLRRLTSLRHLNLPTDKCPKVAMPDYSLVR
jgi:hypothetical protein